MSEKVIWVTGASTGIGREIALEFSRGGHIVVVTARRKSRLSKIVSEIKFAEREASAFVCNVLSERSIQITAKRIRERYGRIDALINNAGITIFKSLLDTKPAEFDTIIGTNLRGAFLCIKAVLPSMIKNRRGHIINIASIAARVDFINSSAYAASKAGLIALSSTLRKEVRIYNIKITNILPGPVETPMWDSRTRQKYHNRMMSPSDMAKIVYNIYNQPKKILIEDIVITPIKGNIP